MPWAMALWERDSKVVPSVPLRLELLDSVVLGTEEQQVRVHDRVKAVAAVAAVP